MSKEKLHSLITTELVRLNEEIDRKIICGEHYAKEARRHRTLTAQIRQMQNDYSWHGFFNRLMY